MTSRMARGPTYHLTILLRSDDGIWTHSERLLPHPCFRLMEGMGCLLGPITLFLVPEMKGGTVEGVPGVETHFCPHLAHLLVHDSIPSCLLTRALDQGPPEDTLANLTTMNSCHPE